MASKQTDNMSKVNNQRIASVEILRSVAMLMVITLHYLDKGGILVPLMSKQTVAGMCAWLLESFCIVAVNTYVLVSGYFLVESGFKLRRLIILVGQVLFYSLLVPCVLVVCGVIPASKLTIYHFINYVFPIQMEHYWFATAYILLYLLVPVLSTGVKQLSEKQLQTTIILLIIVLPVVKTVLPFEMTIDEHGYDVWWFMCLFLIAAYIRLHGAVLIKKSHHGFILYVLSVVGIFTLSNIIAKISNRLGKFDYFAGFTFSYNHILCLLGSIGLFLGFLYWKMPEGKIATLARKIAPYTFGVYLLHENMEIRYLWPKWLGADKFAYGNWSVLHWIFSIAVVFAVGIIVDYLRSLIFKVIENIISKIISLRK